MPVDKQVLNRYKILDKCFRSSEGKTYNELMDVLEDHDIYVNKRTIQNDIEYFKKEYHAIFAEDIKRGRERLIRYEDIDRSVFVARLTEEERGIITRIVEKLHIHDDVPHYQWIIYILDGLINLENEDDFGRHVEFQNNLDLVGGDNFLALLEACMNMYSISFSYKPFNAESEIKVVYPYLLKQYNDRWFLVAKDVKEGRLFTYAFDRIIDGTIKKENSTSYQEPDWDFIDAAFSNLVGISGAFNPMDDERTPISNVKIRVSHSRVPYIKTKPILPWQELKEENTPAGTSILILEGIRINKELESLILSFGPDMEVLEPSSFRERIKRLLEFANHRYQESEV